jgi:DNA-directed RNA polymerase specialized sigma24 family protein
MKRKAITPERMEEMGKEFAANLGAYLERERRAAELKLFVNYLDRINSMVKYYCKGAGDDDVQDAYLEAILAIREYDPASGVPFKSFLDIRIRQLFSNQRRHLRQSTDALDSARFLEEKEKGDGAGI